jgi:hypothetical protein
LLVIGGGGFYVEYSSRASFFYQFTDPFWSELIEKKSDNFAQVAIVSFEASFGMFALL